MRDHVSVTQSTAWIGATTPIPGAAGVSLRSMDLTELTQAHTVRSTAPHETEAETLTAPLRFTTTRIVTTFVETLTAPLVTMTLLAATASVREWPLVTERIPDTHYPKKDVAPGVTLPTVPVSRLGHLLW